MVPVCLSKAIVDEVMLEGAWTLMPKKNAPPPASSSKPVPSHAHSQAELTQVACSGMPKV